MQPYNPPKYLLQALANLDNRRLRLRWSEQMEQWCVERKLLHSLEYIHTLPHYKCRHDGAIVENDSWVRARDGYILIGCWNAQPMLSDWCIKNLQYFDMRRFSGGFKEISLLTIRAEEKAYQKKLEAQRQEMYDLSADYYTHEQHRQGEVVYVPKEYGHSIPREEIS